MNDENQQSLFNRFFSFFKRIEWKVAVKTGIAAALSFFLGSGFSLLLGTPETLISGLWTVQAAIVVQQTHLGSTYKSAWMRFLGVLIGCIMGALFTSLLGSTPLSLGIGVSSTIVICALLSLKDSIRIATLSTSIIIVLWGLHSESNPWMLGLLRFIESCFGITIAMFVAHTLWPAGVESKLRHNMANTLQSISKLFLKTTEDKTFDESELENIRATSRGIRDQFWKNRQLLEDSRLELLSLHQDLEEWKLLMLHVERVFESTRSLAFLNKQHLLTIAGEPVYHAYRSMIAECDKAILVLAMALSSENPHLDLTTLEEASRKLEEALVEFRQTKGTRQYNFDEVEEFYVFFYTIRLIEQELTKSSKHISNILSD